RMAGDLGNLPGGQLGIDVFRQLWALLGQVIGFFLDVDGGIVLEEEQFFDLGIELGNRLLETEESCFTHCTSGCVRGRGRSSPRRQGRYSIPEPDPGYAINTMWQLSSRVPSWPRLRAHRCARRAHRKNNSG